MTRIRCLMILLALIILTHLDQGESTPPSLSESQPTSSWDSRLQSCAQRLRRHLQPRYLNRSITWSTKLNQFVDVEAKVYPEAMTVPNTPEPSEGLNPKNSNRNLNELFSNHPSSPHELIQWFNEQFLFYFSESPFVLIKDDPRKFTEELFHMRWQEPIEPRDLRERGKAFLTPPPKIRKMNGMIQVDFGQVSLTNSEEGALFLWHFYLAFLETKHQNIFDLKTSAFGDFSQKQTLSAIAKMDLDVYRALWILNQSNPEFNPLPEIDPGTRYSFLNYIMGRSALERHRPSNTDFTKFERSQGLGSSVAESNFSINSIEEILNQKYCYPLHFRSGIDCAFKALGFVTIASMAIHLVNQADAIKSASSETPKAIENAQNLSNSSADLNKRFQFYLKQQKKKSGAD